MPDDLPPILIVDDDPSMTRMLEVALRREPVRPVRVHRAFGLLSRIAEERPAVVVLDVMMPGLDGPSFVELLREDAEIAGTPVILWSALDPAALAAQARACGADGYRSKTDGPFAIVRDILSHLAE